MGKGTDVRTRQDKKRRRQYTGIFRQVKSLNLTIVRKYLISSPYLKTLRICKLTYYSPRGYNALLNRDLQTKQCAVILSCFNNPLSMSSILNYYLFGKKQTEPRRELTKIKMKCHFIQICCPGIQMEPLSPAARNNAPCVISAQLYRRSSLPLPFLLLLFFYVSRRTFSSQLKSHSVAIELFRQAQLISPEKRQGKIHLSSQWHCSQI